MVHASLFRFPLSPLFFSALRSRCVFYNILAGSQTWTEQTITLANYLDGCLEYLPWLLVFQFTNIDID